MDTTATPSSTLEFEVLTDEELATVIGGGWITPSGAKEFVYNKIGMCGCGLAH